MDLQEKQQLEQDRRLARQRPRAWPWRAIIAFVIALAAGVTAGWFRQRLPAGWHSTGHLTDKAVAAGSAAGFAVFGMIALLGLSGKARDTLRPLTGSAHAAIIRYGLVLLGGIGVLVLTLDLLQISIGQLVLGGAVTTILIGIAAQQALGNVFAGLVLLLSRPFTVGEAIQLRSGSLGGVIEGTVTEIGITYLCLETRDGPLRIPNSQVLAAGVGPASQVPPGGSQTSSP